MDVGLHGVTHGRVDHAVTLDEGFAFKGRRGDGDVEMAATAGGAGMARVAMAREDCHSLR